MDRAKGNNQIAPPQLSLPKGGGAIKGTGEAFKPNLISGTGSLSIPIYTSASRALTPSLSLSYNSGAGNGVLGLGFTVALPTIFRQTDTGIPRYNQSDVYVFSSEGQLTPRLTFEGGQQLFDEREHTDEQGASWTVRAYLPRVEKAFSQIEQWTNSETAETYWRVTDSKNVVHIFGRSDDARIANPDDPRQVFQWLIEESYDPLGNKIVYSYRQENLDNVSQEIYEVNRSYKANRYIHSIKYGNYYPEGSTGPEAFAFEVIFDYGGYDLSNLNQPGSDPYIPAGEWTERADPFSSYRSGFEIRTYRLCRNILMFQHFTEELGPLPCLVRATQLTYDQTDVFSFLTSATQVGYRRKPDGSYYIQPMPELDFVYSKFEPPPAPVFRTLRVEGQQTIPSYLSKGEFQPVDLYSEGLPGFLYSNQTTSIYYEPIGQGRYLPPVPQVSFPNFRDLQLPTLYLADLDTDGQLEMVVNSPTMNGYFGHLADGSWEGFKPFSSVPTSLDSPAGELVDLDGNGRADLLFVERSNLVFYSLEGISGYGPSQIAPRQPGFPSASNSSQTDLVTFANIFGDGLEHRVRVSNGQVDVWPNLGYGRFDKKVMMGGAPQFDQTTSVSRIYFADTDGSGTADLIFAYTDRLEIYLNQSGNSFAPPRTIQLPAPFTEIDQISFADILGTGVTCVIFTKVTPVIQHWYYQFCGESDEEIKYSLKPYLLTQVDNNLGAKTEIKYSSSTKFYLEDKKAGRPWVTRLPFPVQVVDVMVTSDSTSGTKLTQIFKYHDGYYDSVAREFRGFGFVESWDSETYEAFSQDHSDPNFPVNRLNKELYVPPVYTKTWFNTGAYMQQEVISLQYEQEYFSGDPNAYQMPDSHLDQGIYEAGADAQRQAYSALKGMVLHKEVYAEDKDDPALSSIPYTVVATNYQVRMLQAPQAGNYGSYAVRERESITYNYERDVNDPRIQHDFVLAMTAFAPESVESQTYEEKTCTVHYGRRASATPYLYIYPEQAELKATASIGRFTRVTQGFRMIGVDYERQSFEIGGLSLPPGDYFSFDEIKGLVDEALNNQVPYGTPFSPGQLQSRIITWEQSYYWDLEQNDVLPLGKISERALLHHKQNAVFSDAWLAEVYASKVNQQMLEQTGGYYNDQAGYWWNRGLVQYYFDPQQPERFYLPYKTENHYAQELPTSASGLFAKSTVSYDEPYYLVPTETREYADEDTDLPCAAEIDYNVMTPWQLTDSNNIITQVLFDPLGMVIATSIFKEAQGEIPRQGDGDLRDYVIRTDATFDSVLNNKLYYLQDAASFFYYDLFAWKGGCAAGDCQPANCISLVRQDYLSDHEQDEQGAINTEISYSDGLGELIEEKLEAEPGDAILRDEHGELLRDAEGKPAVGATESRWIVSGRTVYNNKSKPTEQYLPYYSNVPYYETQQEIVDEGLVPPPTVTHYDPLLRVIRVDTPKGFFSKTEYTSWQVTTYDEDDTVKEAPYYIEFFNDYPPDPTQQQVDEKAALDKAAKFYNTPIIKVLDNAGHEIRTILNNLGDVPPDAFAKIVEGSGITSEELWNDVKANGYLETNIVPPVGTWVTAKFQPYTPGFAMQLDPAYQQFAAAVTEYLLQNCLTGFSSVDTQDRLIEQIDPRLFYSNVQGQTSYFNFRLAYDMDDEAASYINSADAGRRWTLSNIFGSIVESWDSRDQQISKSYDGLQRLLTTTVTEQNGSTNLTEVITYGEHQPDAELYNLRGEIYEYKDQAGITLNKLYNLQGQIALTTRQLRQDYKNEVNWEHDVPLESEIYETQFQYDALQKIVSELTPDGSEYQAQYFISNRLQAIQVTWADGTVQPFITNISYSANDQRLQVFYGNQVVQTQTYEDTTERLVALYTTRPPVDKHGQPRDPVVQNVLYTYDPVGNVTLTRDKTAETVFCYNLQVEAKGDYTYDAIYRLIRATGRQHPGIDADTHINGFKQSIFAQLCPPSINDEVKLECYTEEYSYDNSSNLITTRHKAKSASFNRDNPVVASSNRLQGVEYDGNGNSLQLSLNNTVGLTWDYRNNLARTTLIERPDGASDSDSYVYNFEGQRVRKVTERFTNGGSVTQVEDTIYIGNYQVRLLKKESQTESLTTIERQVLRVMDGSTCVAISDYLVSDLYEREEADVGTRRIRYQIDDKLGSVSVELDQEDASLISYEAYFPYGGTAVIAGNDRLEVEPKVYRYSGKECDDSTGLYYYGARYYMSWMGRWLSPDPSGPVDGPNLYEFVSSNPVTIKDIDGRNGNGDGQPQPQRPLWPLQRAYMAGFMSGFFNLNAMYRSLVVGPRGFSQMYFSIPEQRERARSEYQNAKYQYKLIAYFVARSQGYDLKEFFGITALPHPEREPEYAPLLERHINMKLKDPVFWSGVAGFTTANALTTGTFLAFMRQAMVRNAPRYVKLATLPIPFLVSIVLSAGGIIHQTNIVYRDKQRQLIKQGLLQESDVETEVTGVDRPLAYMNYQQQRRKEFEATPTFVVAGIITGLVALRFGGPTVVRRYGSTVMQRMTNIFRKNSKER